MLSINGFRRQRQVQQLRKDAAVGLDELGVHPRQIHLPQIDPRARMALEPAHDFQQPGPGVVQLQRPQRTLSQPWD
ncbi:hypothetical protein D9M72_231260 [compost metagenome]